jgi:hypothetical protein
VDGFSTKALVQTALIAAALFVAFLLGESLWRRYRSQDSQSFVNKSNDRFSFGRFQPVILLISR